MCRLLNLKTVAVFAAFILASCLIFAQSDRPPPEPSGGQVTFAQDATEVDSLAARHVRVSLRILKRYLGLSEDQVEAIAETVESTHLEIEEIRKLIRPLEADLKEAIHTDPPDPAAVGELALQIHELRDTIRTLHQAIGESVEGQLDEDQLKKLERAQRAARLQPLFPAMRRLALIPPR